MGCGSSKSGEGDANEVVAKKPYAVKPLLQQPRTAADACDAAKSSDELFPYDSSDTNDVRRLKVRLRESHDRGPFAERFEVLRPELGRGAYGPVLRAKRREAVASSPTPTAASSSPTLVAVRVIRGASIAAVAREVAILEPLTDVPHVVKLFDVYCGPLESQTALAAPFDLAMHRDWLLVQELCKGDSLFDFILEHGQLDEAVAKPLFKDLIEAVASLHAKNIAHRDLKPESIVFAQRYTPNCHPPSLRLTSLHHAVQSASGSEASLFAAGSGGDSGGFFGAPYYIATEVARGYRHSRASDLWACGVILFTMLSGVPPFSGNTDQAILAAVKQGTGWSTAGAEWRLVSDSAKDIVAKLLNVTASRRMTAAEALEHPWLRNG